MITTEKRFEADIESFFLSPAGGYTKGADTYDAKYGLYVHTLIDFVQRTQPKEWARFENANQVDPVRKFCTAFNTACETDGLLSVLRHGFKHRGLRFRVCYFKPESALNQVTAAQWAANTVECYRQWYFSADTKKSVDMVLVLNGIPVFAFELKNQYTGQTVDDAKRQWMYDRDPRELCFQFNKRILAYFCVDHTEVWMTTKLAGKNTYFLPFNQGSNGAGNDGGKGNPANPNGYPTAYLWENVFQKDSMMDIIQKFMNLKDGKTLIFPRYHQLDVVRKQVFIEALIMEVSSEASFSFGINWAIGGNTGDAAIVGGVSLNGGAVSLSSSGANKTVSLPAGVSIGAILKDAITVGNTSYNIQSILNAVRGNSDVDVLATPQLLTLDNEEASVEVVDNIPFTKESTTRNDNDFTTQSMDYKDVGVKLKITPRISDDGSLRLEVEQEVSRVTQGLITLTNGDQLVAPTTRKRLVKTTILLQDSQTAVIGGLLDDQKTYNQSEVPGLGSIPVLGWLFKSRNKKSTQTNLFIFITPKVIRNAADSADLTREKQLVLHETSVGHDGLGLPIMSKPKLLKTVFVN